MTLLPIRTIGDPVLREPCREVETYDRHLRALSKDMLETMYKAPGVGLAAPQIGLSLRFFVFDAEKGSAAGALANPEIIEMEGELMDEEGCLSIPGLYWDCKRHRNVVARGFNLNGEPIEIEGSDLLARCIQHETDHLDGVLFVDKLDAETRKAAMKAIRESEWFDGGVPVIKENPLFGQVH